MGGIFEEYKSLRLGKSWLNLWLTGLIKSQEFTDIYSTLLETICSTEIYKFKLNFT